VRDIAGGINHLRRLQPLVHVRRSGLFVNTRRHQEIVPDPDEGRSSPPAAEIMGEDPALVIGCWRQTQGVKPMPVERHAIRRPRVGDLCQSSRRSACSPAEKRLNTSFA
jgi:hypothetical protein